MTRTVTGRITANYIAEDGSVETGPMRTAATTAIGAVPDGSVTRIGGTLDPATGDYVIPDVPEGGYLLAVDDRAGGGALDHYQVLPGDTRDVLAFLAGRRGAVVSGLSTPVTLELTGLVPWFASDRLTLVSAGAGLGG